MDLGKAEDIAELIVTRRELLEELADLESLTKGTCFQIGEFYSSITVSDMIPIMQQRLDDVNAKIAAL